MAEINRLMLVSTVDFDMADFQHKQIISSKNSNYMKLILSFIMAEFNTLFVSLRGRCQYGWF